MSSERTVHVPVMVHEVLEQLDLASNLVIVDGTVGAGGHSQKIVQEMDPSCQLIGIDRDPEMLARAAAVVTGENIHLIQGSYAELPQILREFELDAFDRVLVDLGLSSDQLADPQRGFGFDTTGPLDMRFDVSQGVPVAELLATADASELERIFSEYGEEPAAGKLAGQILFLRKQGNCPQTADELVAVVETILGKGSPKKSHPATRLFQSLRIAVNRELEQLDTFLHEVLPRTLNVGGRALVITFHSLEDRLVKNAFRETDRWENLTRKPIVPTPSEVRWNPRSRSAKLRVAVLKEPLP